MKFRLKGSAFVTPRLVEFESNTITVVELKREVGNILHIEEEAWGSLQLSMNGKSVITAEDSQLVTGLGFVSGDTVYILGIPTGAQIVQQQETANAKPCDVQVVSSAKNIILTENKQDEDEEHTHKTEQKRISPGTVKSGEGMLLNGLSDLVAANSDKLTSQLGKFCGLLHLLMVEGGFNPLTTKEDSDPHHTLPDSWNLKQDTLKLDYISSYPPHSKCTIIITIMGPITFVHGQSSIEKTKFTWKLKITDYLGPQLQNLNKLSLEFKNHIVYPLFLAVQRESHGVCPVNLSNLPPEISFLILGFLDAPSLCRLACTSHQFKLLANHPRLWHNLLKRDFRITQPTATSTCKLIYRDEYRETQRRKNRPSLQRPMPSRPDFCIRQPPLPHPVPGGSYFPGMVGGFHDIYPDLTGLEPRRQRFPFQPNRNLGGLFRPRGGGGFPFF